MVRGGRDFSASSNSFDQPGALRKGRLPALPCDNPIFMTIQDIRISFETYPSTEELAPQDAELLKLARKATSDAYAPYSRFRRGNMGLIDFNSDSFSGVLPISFSSKIKASSVLPWSISSSIAKIHSPTDPSL